MSVNLVIGHQQTRIQFYYSTNILIQAMNKVPHCTVITPLSGIRIVLLHIKGRTYEMSHNILSGILSNVFKQMLDCVDLRSKFCL